MGRVPSLRLLTGLLAAGCLLAGLVVAAPAAAVTLAAVSGVGGVFVPDSERLLDTRTGVGTYPQRMGPGDVISLQMAGVSIPPSGVTAVQLNLTAVSPTSATYLTAYPDGGHRPVASSLNVAAGGLLSNVVTVPVGADGRVDFYNHAGSLDLVVDLIGYFTPDTTTASGSGDVFSSLPPARLLDTRDGTGGQVGRVGPGGVVTVPVVGADGAPAVGGDLVVLNVTVVDPTAAGYVVAYPDGDNRPAVSNLNFTAGQTVPNLVVARVGSDGKVALFNANGTADLVADIAGYYTHVGAGNGAGGALFDPDGPSRILDTRDGTGTGGSTMPVGPDQTIDLAVAGQHGVPAGANAVVLNVTATGGTGATYITAYPGGTDRPVASNLNVPAGATISNQVVVPVGADGTVALYNHAGSVHLIADLAGYYRTGAASPWQTAASPVPDGTSAGTDATVTDVACAPKAGCVATGTVGSQALILVSNYLGNGVAASGSRSASDTSGWTPMVAPLPADAAVAPQASITQLSCPTGTCTALLGYTDTTGAVRTALLRGYGLGWTTSPLPAPPTATGAATYRSLACGASGCAALGSYPDQDGTTEVALATGEPSLDGTAWTAQRAPVPDGEAVTSPVGVAVACTSSGCVALARWLENRQLPHPYLISGSGSSWTAVEAPRPADDPAPDGKTTVYQLTSLSCGPAACAVAGYYRDAALDSLPVLLTGDGSSWTASNLPLPADLEDAQRVTFDSIACPVAGRCAATARYPKEYGGTVDVLLTGWGGSWTSSPLLPADAGASPVPAFVVACAGTACALAGGYQDIWGDGQLAAGATDLAGTPGPLLQATAPPRAYRAATSLPALRLACASASYCVAAGTYTDMTGHTRGELLTGAAPTS
jgi:hypothetical protein